MTTATDKTFWANLTLVVIDTETTQNPRGGYRVVDVGAMKVRNGVVTDRWGELINPQIPIDAKSTSIHGITDQAVADKPTFDDVADALLDQLTPRAGETLVVVAHHAGFDLPILRHELTRVGRNLPNLPVLDTARALPQIAGITTKGRSLRALCQSLDIPYSPQHQSLSDTMSLAQAVTALVRLASGNGYPTISDILDAAGTTTDQYIKQPRHISRMRRLRAQLPEGHAERHTEALAGTLSMASRTDLLVTCATARCGRINEIIETGPTDPDELARISNSALATLAAEGGRASCATLVHAVLPHHIAVLNTTSATRTRRRKALRVAADWVSILPDAPGSARCNTDADEDNDSCPTCWEGFACSLDTWIDDLAVAAVGTTRTHHTGFYNTRHGTQAKSSSTYYVWKAAGHETMADAGIAAVTAYWSGEGNYRHVDSVAYNAYGDGCRHPAVVGWYAAMVARPGTHGGLREGLSIAVAVLDSRHGSTTAAWQRLQATASAIEARLERLNTRDAPSRTPRNVRVHPPRFTT